MNLKALGKNKTEVDLGEGRRILVSYNTPVAYTENSPEGRLFYVTETYYSSTTSKHINSWMPVKDAEVMPQEFFDKLLQELK